MHIYRGQDIEVRVPPHQFPQNVVTDDEGAKLLIIGENIKVFLPSDEYPADPVERREFLRELRRPSAVTVRVLERDEVADSWIVSRQAVLLGNPWRDDVPQWILGETVKRMRLTNVYGDQIYGEIAPRVRGTTSLPPIRDYLKGAGGQLDVVLVGDYLVGFVKELDDVHQLVTLDVEGYLRYLEEEQISPPSLSTDSSVNFNESPRDRTRLPVLQFQRILIVDDDPRYLQALKRRLEADGVKVLVSETAGDALSIVRVESEKEGAQTDNEVSHDIEMAIVDVTLNPKGDHIGGLRLASELSQLRPKIKLLLTSGDPSARSKLAKGDRMKLKVHGFIPKPFGSVRIRSALSRAAAATPQKPSSFLSLPDNTLDLTPRRFGTDLEEISKTRIESFQKRVGAENVILFSIHPISLVTKVVAGPRSVREWDGRGWKDFWRQKLSQSPVRDVAIDGTSLLVHDAKSHLSFASNRWLQRAYGYRSCIGVPVRAVGEHAYCLFAFHSSTYQFDETQLNVAEAYAAEMAALLEKERLLRILDAETRYITSGITLSVLGHELRTTLGTAALNTEEVVDLADGRSQQVSDFLAPAQDAREAVRRSVDICEMFIELARKSYVRTVPVRKCVDRAIRFAQHRVKELNARIVIGQIPDKVQVLVERVALEQALFNLLVNAAEQCQLFERRPGQIEISVDYQPEPSPMVTIRVQDNGPGIHTCWWEEIFEPGFTTKQEGSGLGLHICYRSLKKMGGTIKVLSSDLWAGTVFVLTLPAVSPEAKVR